MVALVGQLSGWPVTLYAGIPTPASVTAIMSVGTQAVTP
ncbi:ash family protein [Enterobacter kobei]|nr:ash family protein [Enterobacter kobei]